MQRQRWILLLVPLAAASAYSFPPLWKISSSDHAPASWKESDSTLSTRKNDPTATQLQMPTDRRTSLARIAGLATASMLQQPAHSADVAAAPASPPSPSILEARVVEKSLAPPPYGMEAPDIFYPPAFQGSWRVVSRTVDVAAPCGFELFTGGQAGYDSAVKTEVVERNDLEYRARFVVPLDGDRGGARLVADREYNAREIAKAAMGAYAVVDTPLATPNRYSCLLAPPGGASDLICVDIVAIARRAEPATSDKFVCSEFVRQIVSPSQRNNPNAAPVSPLSVKEIETISIYSDVGKDTIKCQQRTASFLVPSQTDPAAFRRWQLSQGRPVDVRCYDVTYTRA